MAPRTLFAKLWDEHVVVRGSNGPDLLYVDLHLLHEMTSPQAFEGLRAAGRQVRRPDLTMATEDHNVPTTGPGSPVADPLSRLQLELVRRNCAAFGVPHHPMGSSGNGIVHVIGPEQGLTQPGLTIVCGDSHTSTHGAFGALAFGIGTSQVEHVLATQTLWMERPEAMQVCIEGDLAPGVSAKDLALHVVRSLGPNGGAGAVLEYRGSTVRSLGMEQRMTLCNMTIECGARGGMVAPDDVTFGYLRGRRHAPEGARWDEALRTGGPFAPTTAPSSTAPECWPPPTSPRPPPGAPSPATRCRWTASSRPPTSTPIPTSARLAVRALAYMDLEPGTPVRDIAVDTVFIGSCTNGRLEDLRAAAQVLSGRTVAPGVRALVVPGSQAVATAAEAEGLDRIFTRAGFQWRSAGCSMCTAMNPDALGPGQRSASTTNRNFEGRQGAGARTHLVSPVVAAMTAVRGRLSGPGDL